MKILKNKPEACFCAVLLALMTVIMASEIVSRYFLGSSLIWAEELVRYMFIWTIFVGGASCVPLKSHITVDILVQVLPEKVSYWMEAVATVVWLGICCWFEYLAVTYTITVFTRGEVSTAMHIPMWLIYLALPTGFALMIVRLIALIYKEYIRKPAAADHA